MKISLEAYMNIKLDFANFEESNKEIEQYKIENNNALVFINDKEYMKSFLSTGTAVKRKTEVYSAYKSYCKENEFKPMGKKVFYDEISKTGLVEEGVYLGYNIYKFDKDIYM